MSLSLSEWAEAQLSEIELLSSMFPTQEEFEITDQMALAELREFVEGSTDTPPPSRPQFVIKQQKMESACMNLGDINLSCTYPYEYPNVLPEITVRCADLSRAQQTQFHTDLNAYLTENCQGEVCVLSAVEWAKENAHLYVNKSTSATASKKESSSPCPVERFTRLWIYSHHIYNKTKRKNILEWSKELGLSGFSMPGKPGIVCVEGPQTACEEFWSRVKVLTWKKIMIRHREDFPLGEEGSSGERMDSLRRFTGFEEAMFDPHGNRGNHMDLGQLYQFLSEKGCCDVFQMYFGIEGR